MKIPNIYFIMRLLDIKWRLSQNDSDYIFYYPAVGQKMEAVP